VDKLGNILPSVLRRQPGGGRMLGTRVSTAFRTLIGPEPARLCEVVEVRSGVLVITTSSPALAHQLRLDSEAIIERLNAMDLGRRVRSLRVRIGRPTLSE
jgi:hypothetical protein